MNEINKLSDCKTLAQFNEFSKRVETDMNSAGRSFIYSGLNGKQRSYTMNQIVRQFEKCITESTKTATTNLCAEVNEGLQRIDHLNEQDETIDKIREAYPKALEDLPPLPQDIFNLILGFMEKKESDLAAFAQVNKACYQQVSKIEAANDALIAKYGIFGRKQWQDYGVTIGNVPALPEGIEKIMESDCPIWGDKKVSETHRLVLMPKTVNGEPLTLNNFGEIARKSFPNKQTGYCFLSRLVAENVGNTPIDQSYWVLMTKEPIPDSFNKSYADQQTILTDLAVKSKSDYEAPLALEAAVFALTQYFKDGTRLLENNFTHCQENHQGYQVSIGGFVPAGLCVHNRTYVRADIGVAALRVF